MESVALEDLLEEKDGCIEPNGVLYSWAAFFSDSFLPRSFLRDRHVDTDKRHRGLMILQRWLGRIMGDLREDELEPVFLDV